MTTYADLQFWISTDLVQSYTKEWKNYLLAENPELEWTYWLKTQPYQDIPFLYLSNFCDDRTPRVHGQNKYGYYEYSETWNHRVCTYCKKLPLSLWPLFIFECDACEQTFMIKKFPIHYQLCEDCGGEI